MTMFRRSCYDSSRDRDRFRRKVRRMAFSSPVGYGPQVGTSPEGYPVYSYTDPQTLLSSFVMVLPDGRAFYSDAHGRFVIPPPQSNAPVAGALVLGTAGFFVGGAPGAIIGALVGAIVGNQASKKRAA